MRVNDIMSTHVKTVAAASSADDAWELMRGERIHHLVVMNGKAVAGVFSSRDAGGARGAIRPTPASKRAPLNYRAPHTKRHRAFGVW